MEKENDIKNELAEISLTVADIAVDNTYAVDIPAGYFEQLSGKIMSRIQEEEKEGLSDSLKSVRHINVYDVNENYFSRIDKEIKHRIKDEPKVISLNKRTIALRYLAAAVIAGILGISLVNLYINYTAKAALRAENELAIIKAKEILNKGSFNIELNSLKEEDIVGYLTMNGDDVDAALVASTIDEQNLPEAEEYIYNDNTLNNFLNELNIDHQTPNSN